MLILLSLLTSYASIEATLLVSLSRKQSQGVKGNALVAVNFCVDCPTPHSEGSQVMGLQPKFGLKTFHVSGALVYCVPNNAESRKVLNAHHFKDRFVLVNRGNVGLLDKIEKIEDAEAVGVIIADDGRCREDFSFCGPQAGSVADGGFAIYDNEKRWNNIRIPVVLVSVKTAEILRNNMGVREVNIPKLGKQNITIFHFGKDSFRDEL